jgi:hypothetical protein
MKERRANMNSMYSDWQVRLSKDLVVISAKLVGGDMARMRFKPVYVPSGELLIIVPAISQGSAVQKARRIAAHLASAGAWGAEIWDVQAFASSIENLL